MTLTQFYEALETALKTTPGVTVTMWPTTRAVRILHNRWTYCPITFVAHTQGSPRYDVGHYHDAGQWLGLRKAYRNRIAESGDNHLSAAFSLRTRLALAGIVEPYLEDKA